MTGSRSTIHLGRPARWDEMTANRFLVPAVAGTLLLLVAACTATSGPLYGPDAPRSGAGEVIDPHTGLVIPGFPQEAP